MAIGDLVPMTTTDCVSYPYWPTTNTLYWPPVTTVSEPQLVRITTVELMAGYIGQIWHNEEICWESKPHDDEAAARSAAEKHLSRSLWRKS